MNIFISYGHEDYPEFIKTFVADLSEKYNVWTDEKILVSDVWHAKIDENISQCDLFIFIHADYSIRDKSYCWGEIDRANRFSKKVFTIVLESFDNMSSKLNSRQAYRMESVIDIAGEFDKYEYDDHMPLIFSQIDVLLREDSTENTGHFPPTQGLFRADDLLVNFIGRDALLKDIDRWYNTSKRNLAILGMAAGGKSSICAKVYNQFDITALHFCEYLDAKSSSTRYILESIIGDLCRCSEEYSDILKSLYDRVALKSLPLDDVVTKGIAEPLQQLDKSKVFTMIIDGLDEIQEINKKDFFKVVVNRLSNLPNIRFLLTSRADNKIEHALKRSDYLIANLDDYDNSEDIKSIITKSLDQYGISYDDKSVAGVAEQCNGDYLYAKYIIEELLYSKVKDIKSVSFPIGMKGVCEAYFDRIFGSDDPDSYSYQTSSFLGLLCVVKEPIGVDGICDILGIDERELTKTIAKLSIFLNRRDNKICIYHKSLYDWIMNMNVGDPFYVSIRDVKSDLVKWIMESVKAGVDNKYLYDYAFEHIFDTMNSRNMPGVAMLLTQCNEKYLDSFNAFASLQVDKAGYFDKVIALFRELYRLDSRPCRAVYSIVKYLLINEKVQSAQDVVGCYADSPNYQDLCNFQEFYQMKMLNNDIGCRIVKGESLSIDNYDPQTQADILFLLADAYRQKGERQLSRDHYSRVINIYRKSGYYGLTYFESKYALVGDNVVSGKMNQACSQLSEMKSLIVNSAFIEVSCRYYRLEAEIYLLLGDFVRAYDGFTHCVALAEKMMNNAFIVINLNNLAEVEPSKDKAFDILARSRAITKDGTVNLHEYGKSFYVEADIYNRYEEWIQGLECGRRSLEILSIVGYGSGIARAHSACGVALMHLGEEREAIDHFKRACDHYISGDRYPFKRLICFYDLLRCAKTLGELDKWRDYDRVEDILNISNFPNSDHYIGLIRDLLK